MSVFPRFLLIVMLLSLLQGCAGVRLSYESLLDEGAEAPTIRLQVGERREVLAVGNGFPGWWGLYPMMITGAEAIASVVCEPGRSWVPFRQPGMIVGGRYCYLQAHQAGETWALYGTGANMEERADASRIRVIVTAPGE